MTREEYLKAAQDAVYLAACAVNRVSPDADRVKGMNLDHLYRMAEFHLMTAVTAMALESAGVRDQAFTLAKNKAIRKAVLMDAEMRALFCRLDAAGIWHMPLKGSVLKDMYPAVGMRQMSDRDILIDPARIADVKDIMESLGFTAVCVGAGVHDIYYKKPVSDFEIHHALFGQDHDEKLRAYYAQVSGKLLGDGYEKHFSPEDFYIYFIAHQYKHYSFGGTGLRTLMDNYVYLSRVSLNMEYVTNEMRKLNLDGFEAAVRSLSLRLFRGETLTADDRKMLEYILSSGAYGTITHCISHTMEKKGWNKFQYICYRFFYPFYLLMNDRETFAAYYPFFYRHKLLLPFHPFYRVFSACVNGKLIAELKGVLNSKK